MCHETLMVAPLGSNNFFHQIVQLVWQVSSDKAKVLPYKECFLELLLTRTKLEIV